VFVPDKLFQPSLVFVGKARSLPESGAPPNTRLGCKSLSGTNSLAYSGNPEITAVLRFMIQAPGPFVSYEKMKCFELILEACYKVSYTYYGFRIVIS
jgi:hypothetical protein